MIKTGKFFTSILLTHLTLPYKIGSIIYNKRIIQIRDEFRFYEEKKEPDFIQLNDKQKQKKDTKLCSNHI